MINLTEKLIEQSETTYAEFSKKLIPDTKYEILGVRVPKIKKIAKDFCGNSDLIYSFFKKKHVYYEEYFLHGLLIATLKDVKEALTLLGSFLPFVDNWAICDSLASSLKIFKKFPEEAFEFAKKCINSDEIYTIRFGVVILLDYFTDKNFNGSHIDLVKNINSDNYYVKMAIAWYLSVLAVKQYDKVLPYFLSKSFEKFIHNKAISKSCESFRIEENKKIFLKALKI